MSPTLTAIVLILSFICFILVALGLSRPAGTREIGPWFFLGAGLALWVLVDLVNAIEAID